MPRNSAQKPCKEVGQNNVKKRRERKRESIKSIGKQNYLYFNSSTSGLCHTRHFLHTIMREKDIAIKRYCDKKILRQKDIAIKRYCNKKILQ